MLRTNSENIHILVADDEPNIIYTLSILLEAQGFKVSTAGNGVEAMSMIEQQSKTDSPIDLLITDMQMPGLTGYELYRSVNADKALISMPTIIISGYLSTMPEVKEGPGLKIIHKPFDHNDLLKEVYEFVSPDT